MSTGPALGRPIEILLVEDNPGDVRLTMEGLTEGKVLNNLHVARDGVEARFKTIPIVVKSIADFWLTIVTLPHTT